MCVRVKERGEGNKRLSVCGWGRGRGLGKELVFERVAEEEKERERGG